MPKLRWNEEKKDLLIALSKYSSDEEVAEILSETYNEDFTKIAVRRYRQRLNIHKLHGRGKRGIKQEKK